LADPDLSVFEFLRRAAARGFRPRAHDCGLWLADFAMVRLGVPDPCPELRNLDDDVWRMKAERLPAVVARVCRKLGAERVPGDATAAGDIGVLARHLSAPTGAIRTGTGWAQLTATGVVVARLGPRDRVLAAWRLA
jgi:hypothetical protein